MNVKSKPRRSVALIIGCALLFPALTHGLDVPVGALSVTGTISLPTRGFAATLSADGARLYVGSIDSPVEVSVIDTLTNTVVATVPFSAGSQILSMAITPDQTRLYATATSQVEVIDLSSNVIVATILMPSAAPDIRNVAITPDGSRVYVTDAGNAVGLVHVIDTTTNTIVQSIAADIRFFPFLTGVAITPDGTRAYVVSRRFGDLTVIDLATNTVVAAIPTTGFSTIVLNSVAITPDGTRAYVTYVCFECGDDRIAVIDTDPVSPTFNQQVATIVTGDPDREFGSITIIPDGTLALVTSGAFQTVGPNELVIIDTDPTSAAFHTSVGAIPLPDDPWGIVFQPLSVAVAYVTDIGGVSVIGQDGLDVTIDIKPGSFPNSINPNSQGNIPVAILGSDTFDTFNVDTASFGPDGASPVHGGHPEDVNNDGFMDLVFHFKTQETGIACEMTAATLTGDTLGGQQIAGTDSIRTVGCK